jgi:hypothetical protein
MAYRLETDLTNPSYKYLDLTFVVPGYEVINNWIGARNIGKQHALSALFMKLIFKIDIMAWSLLKNILLQTRLVFPLVLRVLDESHAI